MPIVILTRFSRVTFNAMHKYLGLTVELLRTEKAINDLACHPLPNEFYSGGGMQRLRQRFADVLHVDEGDEQAVQTEDDTIADSEDQFGRIPRHRGSSIGSGTMSNEGTAIQAPMANPSRSPRLNRSRTRFAAPNDPHAPTHKQKLSISTVSSDAPFKVANPSRSEIQAGDLHTMAGQLSATKHYRPGPASRAVSYAKNLASEARQRSISANSHANEGTHAAQATTTQDFDLRDEVMSSIAKSIGLLQPPLSESMDASPMLSPTKPAAPKGLFPSSASVAPSSSRNALRNTALFGSAFSNLSYLQSQDDASSVTSLTTMTPVSLSGLDNDVEILFYPAGSTLVRAGERNGGTIQLTM